MIAKKKRQKKIKMRKMKSLKKKTKMTMMMRKWMMKVKITKNKFKPRAKKSTSINRDTPLSVE